MNSSNEKANLMESEPKCPSCGRPAGDIRALDGGNCYCGKCKIHYHYCRNGAPRINGPGPALCRQCEHAGEPTTSFKCPCVIL